MSDKNPKFDDNVWKVEEAKKKFDKDKKKGKKDEFDGDIDKDKDDNKSLDKRIKRLESLAGFR